MKVFVDTSAFVALHDRSDQKHGQAKGFFDNLTTADRLFTSNYIVDETITRLRYVTGHAAAVTFADHFFASKIFSIFYIDEEMEKQALKVLKKFRDKKLSFTDCASMALVHDSGLDAIFAFDDDFRAAGFRTVP